MYKRKTLQRQFPTWRKDSPLRAEMRGFTLNNVCLCGLFTLLLVFSFVSLTTAVSFDLTELRNKVAKIKVNPRGNLWATGEQLVPNVFVTYIMQNLLSKSFILQLFFLSFFLLFFLGVTLNFLAVLSQSTLTSLSLF